MAPPLETIPLTSESGESAGAARVLERLSTKVHRAQALCRFMVEKVRAWAIARTGWGRLVSHTSDATQTHSLEPYAHKHVITYVHAGQSYQVVFPDGLRGPCSIRCVETREQEDVTEDIFEKMGPFHNFHGIPTTPGLLGYTCLYFHCLDGTRIYGRDDVIAPSELQCTFRARGPRVVGNGGAVPLEEEENGGGPDASRQ